ncbi:signal transduction histidine kinase [Neobacillus sp. B4I6]|uniref:sensor histidine kinase n=1 Tax=Neobacillus sp. B4I6 TaxID=3373925 RepID=UPI003D1D0E1E
MYEKTISNILYFKGDTKSEVFVINNAIQSMMESGNITIRLVNFENKAVVEVSDMGVGIEEADLKKIFSPFYTTKSDGTGLGLSICQKIIQDHGGTIDAASILNQGTTFTICFPLKSGCHQSK